ncbi:hypothetical protein [Legionella waltersii]|uniref:Uncharacterized protein n=1 Tax=Legionella waltersii TaxID=66969 RepID=A0A0W1AM26_9GAMM|nr:hypothetical protein [Legionella waltersii]KTD82405.1 hypothetical protein Lwal_0882 [Legionella waltersii]SNV03497.1 Uncharacterised protein [Legionella waltersii]
MFSCFKMNKVSSPAENVGHLKVLKTFPSQHAAAKWLVENGKAKNSNCVSSISSVCLRKPCSTGYGYRKKAYGYGWCFASEIQIKD